MTAGFEKCAICDSDRFDPICTWKTMLIARCTACGVVCSNPRPDEAELLRLYGDGTLLGAPAENEVNNKIEFPAWKLKEHAHILRTLAGFGVRGGKLLDVGCLWGSFIEFARRNGFLVSGIEPYGPAAAYARNVLQLDVTCGSLNTVSLATSSFDAITILDVIEHLRDPMQDLRTMLGLLRPNGVLVVVTPNVDGLLVRVLGLKRRTFRQPWCPIDDLPWHLWGFTPSTIARAAFRAGYQIERVEGLLPSVFTTNLGAGGNFWKRLGLAGVGGVSRLLGQSDRIAAYARRASTG